MKGRRLFWWGILTAILVLAADQISKWWVLNGLDLPHRPPLVLLPVLDFAMVWNRGVTFGMLNGLGRLAIVVGYAALMMLAIAALGVFISTLTEVPVAAMAATLAVAIIMQVLVAVPQLHSIRGVLISFYFLGFADVLRDPFSVAGLRHGSLLALAYLLIFASLAWARFTTKDVSS